MNQASGNAFNWQVKVDTFTLPLRESGRVSLKDRVPKLQAKHGWHYIIYLTDAPHYIHQRPIRSEVSVDDASAVLSIPSMGLARPRVLSEELEGIIHELATGRPIDAKTSQLRNVMRIQDSLIDDDGPPNKVTTIKGLRGRALLVGGMVRSNRPWRLVPHLSSAMAGATATGAFGVFYTSIWSMADYLSTPRLSLITVFSVLVLTLWLLLHNRLWESPQGVHRRERLVVYNTATVLTVSIAAGVMYLLLFVALMLGSLIIIDKEYLVSQLGHEVSVAEYFNLAWLASSLGLMGGAVGSSFDDVAHVQRATFSQREYERRNLEFSVDEFGEPRD